MVNALMANTCACVSVDVFAVSVQLLSDVFVELLESSIVSLDLNARL